MNITIKGKDVELKYSLRSLMIYENVTDKSFNPQGITDIITFFYCVVIASTNDYSLDFNEFIDILDTNPDYINEFGDWMKTVIENNGTLKRKN